MLRSRFLAAFLSFYLCSFSQSDLPLVQVKQGKLQGYREAGLQIFKGIPFAAPPVGNLRWKAPQPAIPWSGIRKADKFGARPMQWNIFGDMVYRSDTMSEDCLFLNVWTPSKSWKEKLPVLVYFYGGGFMGGDGSEPRYDGASIARRGIIAITVNYRLNVFGFLAHPELSKESNYGGSGNYGLMDQAAALNWLQQNVAAFGGDPKKITIAGESAGSVSVSAQMVSPLAKNTFRAVIGSSGSVLGTLAAQPLAVGESKGLAFAKYANANSLAELRGMSADALLKAVMHHEFEVLTPVVDGYFFREDPEISFAKGKQAKVPALIGWNSQEGNYRAILGDEVTSSNYNKSLNNLYKNKVDSIIYYYPASNRAELMQSATDLASDRFIGLSTWRWTNTQASLGVPVYRYFFTKPRPRLRKTDPNEVSVPSSDEPKGAVHSADIEYAMGNLPSNLVFEWTEADYRASQTFQSYYVNFVKNLDPNGMGLPTWPSLKRTGDNYVMIISEDSEAMKDDKTARYRFLQSLNNK